MNYYIQGSPARAKEIKAAFEKLGYNTGNLGFTSSLLYYTIEGKVELMCPKSLQNLIKTHPDYKELELHVEPKFKVRDCITDKHQLSEVFYVSKVLDHTYEIIDKDGYDYHVPHYKVEEDYRLWKIADTKDGDVLVYQDEIFIARMARGLSVNVAIDYDCCYDGNSFILDSFYSLTVEELKRVCPATKEQRELLFSKMKEAGYEWDAEKKELRKIKPHYDIANFKPFDKVLVRDEDTDMWTASLYSNYDNFTKRHFVAIDSCYSQCIPYNNDTKHLLGTTDPCDECYINW